MTRKRLLGRRSLIAVAAAIGTVAASVIVAGSSGSAIADNQPLYLNQQASPQARAADLVSRMTLAEKIGQMTQIEVSQLVGDCNYGAGPLNPTCAQSILGNQAVGSILSGGGSPPTENINGADTPADWANAINAIQSYAIAHNPLHIPIIYGADVVHGHSNVVGDTIFPAEIGMGATYDPNLEKQAETSAGAAALATNVRWGFGPVADVDSDTRWGRYYESFGEDPTLDAAMESAGVAGLQASGQVAASVKHFAGYGGASDGLDRTDANIPLNWLQDDEFPSYQAGISAGADTVMVDSGAIDGVPATSSHYLLTTVLRNQMHFTGVAVSDWGDVEALQTSYHLVGDYEHAVALAINAGVDMTMVPLDGPPFEAAVTSAVKDHLIPMSRINQATERVLELKFKTGIFDHPYVDASKADQTEGADANVARQAAAESSVLLQNNNNVLPLSTSAHITVTGPSADSVANTLGGWTIGWQGIPAGSPETAVTVLDGLKAQGGANVSYAATQSAAVAAAGSTDDYVVVVGSGPGAEGPNDKRDPSLPADQQAEVNALVATGKPVVMVLIDDRPDALGSLENSSGGVTPAGLLMAWRPGTQGGNGVADVLYGATNPSGRLSVSWPKESTDNPNSYRLLTLPNTYNGTGPVYQPLYAFGAGLSYTNYTFGAVTAAKAGNGVKVSVNVTNAGGKAGDLVVPIYVSQPVSDPLVPAKRLVGFTRVHLAAGASTTATVTVPKSTLDITQGDIGSTQLPSLESGQYVFSSGALGSALPTNASASLTF
ncbi:MAG TPA: glycoside hydrolase family 3 N-terminal domain-containing protein [Pseudonocardiaceae bacterium]|jgi:beta-glucosidase|nr:glycoside hydrolase family 3 N-terminal domain-containing protein [Pseudonocardiaceae bacterium]